MYVNHFKLVKFYLMMFLNYVIIMSIIDCLFLSLVCFFLSFCYST